ncbi:type IV secretion system protein VirB10 [Pararhodobacter sp.]|uniref:type IV secretion system protein VirB10 n=1 Tax=Pararhodobacter sp. TaxID=2127056 RepID=UPI002AFE3F58|nr:type IV secretion system protein VirB10 [Pararhodobacter sp.]
MGGALMVGAAGLVLGLSMMGGEKKEDVPKRDLVIRTNATFEPAPAQPRQQAAPEPAKVLAVKAADPAQMEEPDPLLQAATRAPVIAFNGKARNASAGGASDSAVMAEPERKSDEDARFGQLMKPTILNGSKAGTLGNRNFIVAMGASIPCVLETALSSDQPGFASCVIPRDVLSDNGRVVLMPKGTQVVGEYRGGLKRGQSRLFVLWNRAKTPEGVIITLASPATDALGRAGFDGYVDTHFWERFGGALLMSVVNDAMSWIGDEISSRSEVSSTQTTQAGEDAAAIAVENSINIPPTLIKHQGEMVSIFVARDLDFSGVYSLKITEPLTKVYDRGVLGDFGNTNPRLTK